MKRDNRRIKLEEACGHVVHYLMLGDDIETINIAKNYIPTSDYQGKTDHPSCPNCKSSLSIDGENPHSLENHNNDEYLQWIDANRYAVTATIPDTEDTYYSIIIKRVYQGMERYEYFNNIKENSVTELKGVWK